MPKITAIVFCVLALASCSIPTNTASKGKELTLQRIYLDQPSLSGRPVRVVRWLPEGARFLVEERVPVEGTEKGDKAWFQVDAATGKKSPYLSPERYAATIGQEIESDRRPNNRSDVSTVCYTQDLEKILYRKNGDLYIQGLQEGEPRRLTDAPGDEQFPRLSPDGNHVAYIRDMNLFVLDIASGLETRISSDGRDDLRYGLTDWVHDEELGMMRGVFWAPDSRRLAYFKFDTHNVPRIPMVDYLPHGKDLKMLEYPKPGDPIALVDLFVFNLENQRSERIETGEPGSRYLPRVGFLPDGGTLWVQVLHRDMAQLELLFADPETGAARVAKEEFSKSWVSYVSPLRFLDDGRFLWYSNQTGFRHLYLCGADGKTLNAITKGAFNISGIAHVDEENELLYFTASGARAAERHLFKVGLDGSGQQQITSEPGSHEISMDPSGAFYIDTFSTLSHPARKEVYRTVDGAKTFVLDSNQVPELEEYCLGIPEFLKIPTSDGIELNALLLKPGDFDLTRRYPVICSTYGGPSSQTVRNRWGGSGWLWAHMLTQRGFLVFWLDHRGCGDHGHQGASQMHRRLCTIEWKDQVVGIDYLRDLPYVAPDRIGIYGWSYGGTTAVTCLLKAPDDFKAAAAVAPVLDFANYDAIYTERFMDQPVENPDGYAGTNLSRNAKDLKGHLLLIHGLKDDNVLAQNTFQLAWALQDAGKPFEMMIYPKGGHGIGSAKIRKHLFETITRFFEEKL